MKTKTSLLTALVAFAGGASLMAQVYSVNMVGYINLSLNSGFNLVANQLVAGTNGLGQVFPTAPDQTLAYKFNSGTGNWQIDIYIADPNVATPGWYDSVNATPSLMTVSPGEGIFLYNPGAATNLTLVGEVKTGTNTVTLNSGFALVSSVVPASYELVGSDFPTQDQMLYYKYLPSGQWEIDIYIADPNIATPGWYDSVNATPVTVKPVVGQGFFVYNPGSSVAWTRSFSVN